MSAYVIKSWSASDKPDQDGNYVNIYGRAGGFISWLLNLLDISPTVRLTVNSEKLAFHKGSLEGTVNFLTPLENTCTMFYAYKRPLKEAIVLGVLIGGATFFLLGIPGILVAVLYYVLNKTLTIGFTDIGGRISEIPVKRSVIEGQSIDEVEAGRVCNILQQLVDSRRERALSARA